jgi:hypothetical protein
LCVPDDGGAEGFGLFRNLSVGDGEVAVEFKVAQGPARATIGLYVRAHERDALGITINPAEGAMSVCRRTNGQSARIATRRDLGDSVDPLDWNRFAIRTRGPETWLLLNEEPMLYTADAGVDDGGAYFVVIREGNPDDQEEVSVVFRNLTVSALADGDPTRAPALRPTPPRP